MQPCVLGCFGARIFLRSVPRVVVWKCEANQEMIVPRVFPVDGVVPFGVSCSTKSCSYVFVSCGCAVLRPIIVVLLSIRST
jgi:hypothetical protein